MTMKKAIRVVLWVGVLALSLGTWAVAQTSVTLTGPPPGNTYDNVYVSPYYATVGGVANTPVVCDDFGDNTSMGDQWKATITPFPTGPQTSTSWGMAGATLSQYNEVAWFTMALINMPKSVQPANALTQQVIDSFALWAVFDPSGVASYLKSFNGNSVNNATLCQDIFGSADCSGTANGSAYLNVTGPPAGGYLLEVLSPDLTSGGVCQAGHDTCKAQEFIAAVPEGGAAIGYLFLAGLCCFGAMFLRSRRQTVTITAA
jgi:hypothetical protein